MNQKSNKNIISYTVVRKLIFFLSRRLTISKITNQISLKKNTLNFIIPHYFFNIKNQFRYSLVISHFLDLYYIKDAPKLKILVTFTQSNFFISILSNRPWNLFKYGTKLRKRTESNSLFVITTASGGMTALTRKRKIIRTFDNFELLCKKIILMSISTFWLFASINNRYVPYNMSLVFKGEPKWFKGIVHTCRSQLRSVYWNHLSFLLKHKSRFFSKKSSKTLEDFNFIKQYNYSLERLESFSRNPLVFNNITFFKKNPHNGCKTRKRKYRGRQNR